jgi:hypothetical protein
MGKRALRLLTEPQMQHLTTERLLKYKARLLTVQDGPDWDVTYEGAQDRAMHKQRPEWMSTYEACKVILAKREHVQKIRKMAGRNKP